MKPERVTGLVVVTAPTGLAPPVLPDWLSPGSIYRERDVAEWAARAEGFEVVAREPVDLHRVQADPLPVYEVRARDA